MSQLSQELWASAEQILSGDLTRLGAVTSREVTNLLKVLFAEPSSGSARDGLVGQYPPIAPVAATFTANLSGEINGFVFDPIGAGGDVGAYRVLRLIPAPGSPTATVAFAPPSASPRIDLVVVRHATDDTNPQTRNILVDPTNRVAIPQVVDKDRNPVSVVSVVTGTPAASPVPPATPSGSLVLYQVLVPVGSPDAAFFAYSRAAPILTPSPTNVLRGPEGGVHLLTDRPSVGDLDLGALLVFSNTGFGHPSVWIDGELVRQTGPATVDQDLGAAVNPFSNPPPLNGGAPALGMAAIFGKCAYLYAYGGRHNPHPSGLGWVVSLVKPFVDGRPSAVLTVTQAGGLGSRTIQQGACFVSPVHYGNLDGTGGVPDLGGVGYIQQSWSSDGVLFAYPIAVWENRSAGALFSNMNIPSLVGGTGTTTIQLADDWLPQYVGNTPTMATSLLFAVDAQLDTDAATTVLSPSGVSIKKPDGSGTFANDDFSFEGMGRGRTFEIPLAGQTSLSKLRGHSERWFERSELNSAILEATAGSIFSGAGDWSFLKYVVGVIGYKMAHMPRGRL